MNHPATHRLIVLSTLAFVLAGCGRNESTRSDVADRIDGFGALPGLRHSPDELLQEHLVRIEQQQGTPKQLDSQRPVDTNNVAVALAEVFAPNRISRIAQRSEQLFPRGRFEFDAIAIQHAIRFAEDYAAQRQGIRQALARPECRFRIQHTQGIMDKLPDLAVVRLCVRLEGLAVAETLFHEQKPSAAIEPLRVMFQLVAHLASEKHLASRLEAARLRRQTIEVVEAVAQHPMTDNDVLTSLLALIESQLEHWPADADAWIGDRALGLHTYELVRSGYLLTLLSEEEMHDIRQEFSLNDLLAVVRKNLDLDQAFYLDAMQTIIAACKEPYYKRLAMFDSLREDLKQREETALYPFVSGQILLHEVEGGHRLQARDLALCESWAIALAAATGQSPRPYKRSPLSGLPYDTQRESRSVVFLVPAVNGTSATRRVVIPRGDLRRENQATRVPASPSVQN